MTKRAESKYKINRRLGVNLWGRPKSSINNREYPPGQHGQRRRKASDFGTQLMAKQKLKGYYGNIGERQFRRIYQEATRLRGDTVENLIGLLERRLDAVIYRMKFVPTVFAARQFVSHGHVNVNGKRVNIPSYQVRPGDVIEIAAKAKSQLRIKAASEAAESRGLPEWMEIDTKGLKGTFKNNPARADLSSTINESLIIELYSK
jgi:small subunit ribosomal protein S4